MPYAYSDFQNYAPLSGIPETVFGALKDRVMRFVDGQLDEYGVLVTPANEPDVYDAYSAYLLALISGLPVAEGASDIKSFRIGGITVDMPSKSYTTLLEGKLSHWVTRTWWHLYAAGVPRPPKAVGAVI